MQAITRTLIGTSSTEPSSREIGAAVAGQNSKAAGAGFLESFRQRPLLGHTVALAGQIFLRSARQRA